MSEEKIPIPENIQTLYQENTDVRKDVVPLLIQARDICTTYQNMLQKRQPYEDELQRLKFKASKRNPVPKPITIILTIPFFALMLIWDFFFRYGYPAEIIHKNILIWFIYFITAIVVYALISYIATGWIILPLLALPYRKKLKAKIENIEQKSFELMMDAIMYYKANEQYFSFLPEKYRTLDAISHFLEYFNNFRADSMKEALNLYESSYHPPQTAQYPNTFAGQQAAMENAIQNMRISSGQ